MAARALSNALSWEKSRLSHQLRRMQKDGLISREPNPDDARSIMVCLLKAGRAAIEKAAPGHVEDVRRNFIELFSPPSSTCSPPSMNESCTTWPQATTPRRGRARLKLTRPRISAGRPGAIGPAEAQVLGVVDGFVE